MSHVTKTGLWLMLSLPLCFGALAVVFHYWPMLSGEDFKRMPVLVQLPLLAFCVSIPAFFIGGILVLADYIRTRKEKRTSIV